MDKLSQTIAELSANKTTVRFARLVTICQTCFGKPRIAGSHHIFRTPWPGDPRINLQMVKGGMAKPYQVRQVIGALERLEEMRRDG